MRSSPTDLFYFFQSLKFVRSSKESTAMGETCQSATFWPGASSAHCDMDEKKKRNTKQVRCHLTDVAHSFLQVRLCGARLARRCYYARPGSDCQPNSVSQYLPVVIRVDGLINKGKLQERKQTSSSPHQNICAPLASGTAGSNWSGTRNYWATSIWLSC